MKITVKLLAAVGGLLSSPVMAGSGPQGEPQDESTTEAVAPEPEIDLQEQIDIELSEHPGAVQTGVDEISFDNGEVVLSLGESRAARPCPRGWFCVYQNSNHGGRMLRFSQCRRHNLGDYGFRDQASSWMNQSSRNVRVHNDLTARPDQQLWAMPSRAQSRFVGAARNDKADYITCP